MAMYLSSPPPEFTSLLVKFACNDDSRIGRLDGDVINEMIHAMNQADSAWRRLGCALTALGNINGSTSDVQAAVFRDENEAFVSRIETSETPKQSTINHFVQAHQNTPLFAEEFGVDTVHFAVPTPEDCDLETAFSYGTEQTDTLLFAQQALAHRRLSDVDLAVPRYPSRGSAETARDYATICISFLELLKRAYSATAKLP